LDEHSVAVSTLITAAAGGDEDAWGEIVERYAPLVMSVLARHRLFGADAQDVSQIVWMRLVEHLGDLREPRALPMWLITTTRNECLRLLKSQSRAQPFDPLTQDAALEVDDADVADRLLKEEQAQALLEAAAELSERDRALLALLTRDPPLPYAEIARRMSMPVGAIGPTRSRILRKLRSSPALVALFGPEQAKDGRGGGHHDVASVAG
jgi:RNA polymerase sigma factor (sigma-70 family)